MLAGLAQQPSRSQRARQQVARAKHL